MRPGFAADLARRLGTAAIALPLLWAVVFVAPAWATVLLVAVAVVLGMTEFESMLAARGVRPLRVAGFVAMALAFLGPLPYSAGLDLVPAAVVVMLAASLGRASDMPSSVPAAAATLLGALYLGSLGGTLAALRVLAPDDQGAWRVLLLLIVVMINDTGAYFTGSALGRRKLAPAVSPGKTIEGTIGGIVAAVAAAILVREMGLPDVPVAHAAALGAGVAIAADVGDLAESLMKRWAGVKDSGRLFPGHGGMLDRLDSLLFGAPVLYHYFAIAS